MDICTISILIIGYLNVDIMVVTQIIGATDRENLHITSLLAYLLHGLRDFLIEEFANLFEDGLYIISDKLTVRFRECSYPFNIIAHCKDIRKEQETELAGYRIVLLLKVRHRNGGFESTIQGIDNFINPDFALDSAEAYSS